MHDVLLRDLIISKYVMISCLFHMDMHRSACRSKGVDPDEICLLACESTCLFTWFTGFDGCLEQLYKITCDSVGMASRHVGKGHVPVYTLWAGFLERRRALAEYYIKIAGAHHNPTTVPSFTLDGSVENLSDYHFYQDICTGMGPSGWPAPHAHTSKSSSYSSSSILHIESSKFSACAGTLACWGELHWGGSGGSRLGMGAAGPPNVPIPAAEGMDCSSTELDMSLVARQAGWCALGAAVGEMPTQAGDPVVRWESAQHQQ